MSVVDIRNPMYRRHIRPIAVSRNVAIEPEAATEPKVVECVAVSEASVDPVNISPVDCAEEVVAEATPAYFADIPVPVAPNVSERIVLNISDQEESVQKVVEEDAVVEDAAEAVQEEPILVETDSAETEISAEPAVPVIHYFYCRKADGTLVTYKKNTATKTYKTEVPAFRKYLANQGIEILSEEIK